MGTQSIRHKVSSILRFEALLHKIYLVKIMNINIPLNTLTEKTFNLNKNIKK